MLPTKLGEFEQAVLVAVLEAGDEAFALEVRRSLEESSGKEVSRGAFYATVERLRRKRLVTWEIRKPASSRRATKQRRFRVTPDGVEALRDVRRSLELRCAMLDDALGGS